MELAREAINWFSILPVVTVVAVVLTYVYWPSNKKRFDKAATSILHGEDKPWPQKRDPHRR